MKIHRTEDFVGTVEARYPGLLERIRVQIEDSETKFDGKKGPGRSHLWGHTVQVAGLAFRLAKAENSDPLLPTVAALVHDMGKFVDGCYHPGERSEEEEAVGIGAPILRRSGMSRRDVRAVSAGLRALYRQGARKNTLADFVHDADFLTKFGALGVANFFIKSTLRGETLENAVSGSLSKELTYAACLPLNMRTAAGRRLAESKAKGSLRFFRALLREMREIGTADIRISRRLVPAVSPGGKPVEISLVLPRSCRTCSSRWAVSFRTERGLKCERLEAEILCPRCGRRSTIDFCLPEIPEKRKPAGADANRRMTHGPDTR